MTADQLARILACPVSRAAQWIGPLTDAMAEFNIDTPGRQAAFLAQVGHESGRLQYVRELWGPEQCPWQARYEGRADLGNTEPGDGAKYKGRGLIQITGRANYRECGQALGADYETNPTLLELPGDAARSAAWFWHSRNLNALADAGDFRRITQRINGGLNGYGDRLAIYGRAQRVLAP